MHWSLRTRQSVRQAKQSKQWVRHMRPAVRKSTPNLAVFCSGNGSNFQAIVDAVRQKRLKASIALMVCDEPGAFAMSRALKSRVPVVLMSPALFKDRRDYEKTLVGILRNQEIDLIVLAGFMRIFTPYFINAHKNRIVNVHPSYLPQFKGAHAIKDALNAGAKVTGVTVHLVTAQVDSGRVLAQEKVRIAKSDTLESLEKKIHSVEHRLYPQTISNFLKTPLGTA